MTFGEAITKMQRGSFVAREAWNGKNMFIYITEGMRTPVETLCDRPLKAVMYRRKLDQTDAVQNVTVRPHIDMIDAQGCLVCGWLASQTDMLADDWFVREYAQNV